LSKDGYENQVVGNLGVFYFNSPYFRAWQIITYMFIHGGWEHILFNMFALFSFGPILEYAIGPKRFFNLYFICGIGAIAFQMFVQAFEIHSIMGSFTVPYHFGVNDPTIPDKVKEIYFGPVVGASGAIFGVLVAFGMLYPNLELMILFIPVPIKAKYIIPIYVVIEIILGFGQFGGDNVAHFAHLGGALLGFILIKLWRYQ
jgi:rhomboid-like protein